MLRGTNTPFCRVASGITQVPRSTVYSVDLSLSIQFAIISFRREDGCGSLPPFRGVLSFRSEARETSGSGPARVHAAREQTAGWGSSCLLGRPCCLIVAGRLLGLLCVGTPEGDRSSQKSDKAAHLRPKQGRAS